MSKQMSHVIDTSPERGHPPHLQDVSRRQSERLAVFTFTFISQLDASTRSLGSPRFTPPLGTGGRSSSRESLRNVSL